ncbi:uncharacterized protein CELE_T12A7.10 [Caenorhabditis elegans]|uniref:Secreted protein n=1 Tax=Caenorhabditis elegans TaxID=6239 RepID=D3KFV3_CAEEL|nr:Secreted protein [Caenorhabditis elegans]CBJ25096.1 Secreted protein [Caenorhabditis elegans]|eukprot:NP_001255586.1 Uncharacterized protein CELE_T12A7.10 [Caenorhabditis elegans]
MRLIFLLSVFVIFNVNGCQVGPCLTNPPFTAPRNRYPDVRPTRDPNQPIPPDAQKCGSDEDCEHEFMENEVAFCDNGYCNNYVPRG